MDATTRTVCRKAGRWMTFRDMTDEPYDCDTCKHRGKDWHEMPCDACCGAHCGYEEDVEG